MAILEIVTGGLGILLEAIRPMAGLVYGLYGLLLPVWFIAVGIRLFRVGFRVRITNSTSVWVASDSTNQPV